MNKLTKKKVFTAAYFTVSLILIGGICLVIPQKTSPRSPAGNGELQTHQEYLRLTKFTGDYSSFYLSNTEAYSQLVVVNDLPVEVEFNIKCDQPYGPKNDVNNMFYRILPKEEFPFMFGPNVQRCQLGYKNVNDKNQWGVFNLYTETLKFPWLKALIQHTDNCVEANRWFSQLTCPHHVNPPSVELLTTSESGLEAKVEMLLGQKLPTDFIKNQNPFASLDFSKTPKLKAIFIATLVYRSDFYGNVIARLLKYHAEQKTLIYLVTTQYMMLEKDKKLLRALAAQYPNFRLQEFVYNDPHYDPGRPLRYIDTKFRDMHIKLFITLADEEKGNAVVVGGRNIHDGFLYETKPDYSKMPELVQYGVEEDFVHWNDFEVKVISKQMAELTAQHLLKFLNRDTFTQKMKAFTYPDFNENAQSQAEPWIQHFISLPYNDGMALETLYIQTIDQAKKSIKLSSPYLRPTDKILKSIFAASKRGVDVQIQTRVDLNGDTQAWLYEEVNKESINKLFDHVKIYQWKQNSILHSKFLIIDDATTIVGSVNLSRRSFIQDVENGFIVNSSEFASAMTDVFSSYLTKSTPITEKETRKLFPSIIIQLLQNQF